jgi:Uma2 family endonuclease
MTKAADIQNLPTKRWTVEEYHRMIEQGFFSEDDRVELLFGQILPMTPVGIFHASTVDHTVHLCRSLDPAQYIIRVQNPITDLLSGSEPESDVCILKYRSDFYGLAHPSADDIVLLIEVADSSLDYDRSVKAAAYAAAGIEEYWILNCIQLQLEQYSHPQDGEYQEIRIHKESQIVATLLLGDIHVKELFPFA